MPQPVVCPSCSRVFPPTLDTCPGCGWQTELSANHRRTKLIAEPGPTRFAKIELEKQAVRADRPLELPPEDDEPAGAAPVPRTRQERAFTPTPAPRLGDDVSPTDPHLGGPAPALQPVPVAAPALAPGALELPPDGDGLPELPTGRAPAVRPSAPRPPPAPEPAVTRAASLVPDALTEALEPTALRALGLTLPFGLLLAVDASTAGRPGLPGVAAWLAVLLLGASTFFLARLSRLSLLGTALAGLLLALAGLPLGQLSLAATLTWTLAACASQVLGRLQPLALGVGLAALLTLAPAMLDGVLETPLLGGLRARVTGARGTPVAAPFIDQRTGLQLGAVTPALELTPPATATRFVDPRLGLEAALTALPPRLDLDNARRAARDWLESLGLERVTLEEPTQTPGRFDASTTQAFSALRDRATLRGQVRVGILGADTFAVAAWSRAHREPALTQPVSALLASAVFQPPARPRLGEERRRDVARAVVRGPGELVGVRVSCNGKVVLVVPASASGHLELSSEQGTFPVELGPSTVVAGVRLLELGGGAAVPLRRLAAAPRTARVILVGDGFTGGWLTDEPGAATRRADLPDARPGPVVDAEGHLVGFAVREAGALVVTTVDALEPALARVTGGAPTVTAADTAPPAPLYAPAAAGPEALVPSPDVTDSVLFARTSAGVSAATVIAATPQAWALVVDAVITPPGTTAVSVRLPRTEARAAEVARVSGRVALLRLPREDGDGLAVLPLVEAPVTTAARRATWGFRDDPATGAVALKPGAGLLSADTFEPDPGPALSSGPVLSADGRVAALRLTGGQAIVPASALQRLTAPGVRDVFWRIAGEATGTCQLAATIELEDPLEEATLVRVRVAPDTGSLPARLTAPGLTDTIPAAGKAALLFRFRCFTAPQLMQFEVQGPTGARASRVQRVPTLTALPGVIRGRAGPSEGAGRAPAALITELWEVPPPVTLVHPCRSAPERCERACYVDELDACTLDGRFALATKEIGRAIARLDARCADDDLEACTLLLWALAEKRSARTPASKPDAVLTPFCQGGLQRACAALAAAEWKKALAGHTATCARSKRECDDLGRHLLLGPRLDADVTRALKAFRDACAAGNQRACADSALEALRYEREEPLDVLPRAEQACAARFPDACLLGAMNAARGLTVPRTPQAAEKALADACAAGSVEACLMSL